MPLTSRLRSLNGLERARSFLVLCGVVVKGLHQLVQAGKAGPVQHLTRQCIQSNFNQVKPARTGGREVKRHVGVRGQPALAALVAREVVHHGMT